MSTTRPTPQLFALAPIFPELLRDPAVARRAFYEELLAEGEDEILMAAAIWEIPTPPFLTGDARLQYLAGKVAEAEFPIMPALMAAAA